MKNELPCPARKVVAALKDYRKSMDDWVKPITNIKKFRAPDANAFLLGVMFDKNINAEYAWEAAEWFNDSLGDSEEAKTLWQSLIDLDKLDKNRLIGFLKYGYGGYAFHTHFNKFARLLPQAAAIMLDKYQGDPRNIWNNQRDIAEVRKRLEELPGIGPALSRMAVSILAIEYGLLGGKKALPQIDIKPDILVMRVFRRTGLIKYTDKEKEAIAVAKICNPEFPGELDAPSWEIGRTWCKPTSPKCKECPITEVCPKIIRKKN